MCKYALRERRVHGKVGLAALGAELSVFAQQLRCGYLFMKHISSEVWKIG